MEKEGENTERMRMMTSAYVSIRQHTSAYATHLVKEEGEHRENADDVDEPARRVSVSICTFAPAAASVFVLLYQKLRQYL